MVLAGDMQIASSLFYGGGKVSFERYGNQFFVGIGTGVAVVYFVDTFWLCVLVLSISRTK